MLVRAFGVDDAGLKGFWQRGRKIAMVEAASSRLEPFGDSTRSYIFFNSTKIRWIGMPDSLAE
jgi:hypothetical protein